MGKPFAQEIDRLSLTYDWAVEQNVLELSRLMRRWTDGPLIVVGSGGSYSAAHAWAALHREAFNQPSFAVTPLGLPSLLATVKRCKVLLISAEGRNSDVLNAAYLTRSLDIPCAALTLTPENPITRFATANHSLYTFPFDMDWEKDGYLATNTLFAMVLLAARVYLNQSLTNVASFVSPTSMIRLRNATPDLSSYTAAKKNGALILHGPESGLFALDLESKFSESALLKTEIVDFRQFSHGRHLQLSKEIINLPYVIVAYTKSEENLAASLVALFPPGVKPIMVHIPGENSTERHAFSLVQALLITEAFGAHFGIDPGQPDVPEFGRKIYSQDSSAYLPVLHYPSIIEIAVSRKLQNAISDTEGRGKLVHAAKDYVKKVESGRFKAIVCDFDGTLCHVHQRYAGMHSAITTQLIKLAESGINIGVATGRGNSVLKNLKEVFPPSIWTKIWVGLYSGSVVSRLDECIEPVESNDKFDEVLNWLENSPLRSYAMNARGKGKAGQLSFRVEDHEIAFRIAAAVNCWIFENKKAGWRVFTSGHSLDVLDASAGKTKVIDIISARLNIDPAREILRIGDAGQIGGNDYELLRGSISLSAERVSESLDCCWNLSPVGVRQADATSFYLNHIFVQHEVASIKFPV